MASLTLDDFVEGLAATINALPEVEQSPMLAYSLEQGIQRRLGEKVGDYKIVVVYGGRGVSKEVVTRGHMSGTRFSDTLNLFVYITMPKDVAFAGDAKAKLVKMTNFLTVVSTGVMKADAPNGSKWVLNSEKMVPPDNKNLLTYLQVYNVTAHFV